MKKKKLLKILALVLAALMVIALFGACAKEEDETTKTPGTSKTAAPVTTKTAAATAAKTAGATSAAGAATAVKTEAAPETETDAAATEGAQESPAEETEETGGVEEEAVIDMKGQTILLSYYGTTEPDFAANAQYAVFGKRLEEAQEKFNFKIEKVNFGGSNTSQYGRDIITNMIAGLRTTDIATISTFSHYMPFVKNKILLELDDKINFEDPLIKAYDFLYNFKWKGKHYVLTPGPEVALGSWTTPYNIGSMQYNSDLFQREGQPDILDLVIAKRWNWETFLDVCINLTRDTNGDGVTDQWAMTSDSTFYFAQMMLYSNGAIPLVQKDDGKYAADIFDVEAQRAFQFISDLAYVHKVFKYPGSTACYQYYANGQAAMFINVAGYNSRHQGGYKGAPLKSSLVAPVPLGPDVDDYLLVVNPTLYGAMVNTPYANEIGEILKYVMVSWDENLNTLPYLREVMDAYPKLWEPGGSGADRIVITTKKEYDVNFNVTGKKMYIDYYIIGDYAFSNMLKALVVNPIMDGKMSVSQALESGKTQLEAFVDEYCEQ
ncbi:MAG: extracellular solute-binding protein [Eubacteriales bacterium]|nr:extracellular solute-binding protein [Eubacteriales bacterium]